MKRLIVYTLTLGLLFTLSGCQKESRAEKIVKEMTLEQKAAQMVQPSVVGEQSYAEWMSDSPDMALCGEKGLKGNTEAIEFVKETNKPTVTCIVAGRQVIIDEYKDNWDSIVMCYLPGSEGRGVANVLCGLKEFKGKLPSPWYSSVTEIGTEKCWLAMGYGLEY